MRITVHEVTIREESCFVRFSTLVGDGLGYWQGEPPEAGGAYDVELTIPSFASGHAQVRAIREPGQNPAIYEENGAIVLIGQFQAGGWLGVGELKLGDYLVLLDEVGADCPDGATLRIDARYVTLFPFEL